MNAPPPPPPLMSSVVKHDVKAVSLADLYRKARQKGVLTPFTHYPNS